MGHPVSKVLSCSILMFGLPALANHVKSGFFSFYTAQVFPYVTPLVYPIGLIAQSSSVYLTLLVTIERYVAVCSPLRARYVLALAPRCGVLLISCPSPSDPCVPMDGLEFASCVFPWPP